MSSSITSVAKPPRRHPVVAVLVSLVLVLVGILVVFCGLSIAITAVIDAVEQMDLVGWIYAVGLVAAGLAIVFAGVRFVTRLRPWLVRRLTGCEVPSVPAPLKWLATADTGGGA